MIMSTDIRELEQDIADNVALDFEDIISSDYPTDRLQKKLDLIDGAISELINGDLSTVTKVEHYLIDELKEEHEEVTEEHDANAIIIHHLENNC